MQIVSLIQLCEEECYFPLLVKKKQTERLFVQDAQLQSQVFRSLSYQKSIFFSPPSCLSEGILERTDEYISLVKKLTIIPKLVMI